MDIKLEKNCKDCFNTPMCRHISQWYDWQHTENSRRKSTDIQSNALEAFMNRHSNCSFWVKDESGKIHTPENAIDYPLPSL
jgi:hypothetical protein